MAWRVVRVVEGAALEMLCGVDSPRVRIPNPPPNREVGYTGFLFYV